MSVKGTQLTLTYRNLIRNKQWASSWLGLNMNHRNMTSGSELASETEQIKWKLHLDIVKKKDAAKNPELSLLNLIKLYLPWEVTKTKLNLWQLKMLWDWQFKEEEFVNNSKQALVLATKLIVNQREDLIQRCTTSMGFKQIKHDLLRSNEPVSISSAWPLQTMRFEERHICQAMPLKVERLVHYDHRFAFIDMIFFVRQATNDFAVKLEAAELKQLMQHHGDVRKFFIPNTTVVAEIFVRFRRDYSVPATKRAGHWLISSYKILNLDVLNSQ